MNWLRDEASTDEEASSKLSSKESTENNLADEIPKNDHLIVNPSPSHEQLLNILRESGGFTRHSSSTLFIFSFQRVQHLVSLRPQAMTGVLKSGTLKQNF